MSPTLAFLIGVLFGLMLAALVLAVVYRLFGEPPVEPLTEVRESEMDFERRT